MAFTLLRCSRPPWRFRPLLASATRVEEEAGRTTDLNAVVTINALALSANQRTNAVRPCADRVKRIQAGQSDIEAGVRVLVKELQCSFRAGIPVAVHRSGIAADTLEMSLEEPCNIGRVHLKRRLLAV